MNIFESRRETNGKKHVPVWFMRQAGRYHSHYQNIKKHSDFMTMCKTPDLACEITLGPIQDFKFDAAILFSDLLFPLEQMGMGLNYLQGPPELGYKLETTKDLARLHFLRPAKDFYKFQADALTLLKQKLPQGITLLGFVGGPWTLYTYAVEGSHSGALVSSKKGIVDGRYQGFLDKLLPDLLENMLIQAQGGADAVALFDTAAGELSPHDYHKYVVPVLDKLIRDFKKAAPTKKVIYYSKHTHTQHIAALANTPLDVIGVDWRCDLVEVAKLFPKNVYLQGNFDPAWLHWPKELLLKEVSAWMQDLKDRGFDFSRWICGLGHGVLIQTPEENVRAVVELIHKDFIY